MNSPSSNVAPHTVIGATVWEEICDGFRGGVVDLSGPEFRLTSLKGLQTLVKDSQIRPFEVIVKHNSVTSLFELNVFSLRKIDASNNRIEFLCSTPENPSLNGWPSKMSSLVELDLSFNRLTGIPDLSHMPALKILSLFENSITARSFGNLAGSKNLEKLDLRKNQLSWSSEDHFTADTKVFKQMRKLRSVNLAGNKVVEDVPDYAVIILAHIRSAGRKLTGSRRIEQIDSVAVDKELKDRADYLRRKSNFLDVQGPAEDSYGPAEEEGAIVEIKSEPEVLLEENPAFADSQEANKVVAGLVPTLTQLSNWLEDCFIHPSNCLKNLAELTRDVHGLSERTQDHKYLFQIDTEQTVELVIDEFLQNIVLLSERQPQVIHSLLRILVYLSTVSENELGHRCVQQLRDLMGGGEHHALNVITVINDFMVPLLDTTSDSRLREVIARNLIELAKTSNDVEGLDVSPLDEALNYIASYMLRARGPGPPPDVVVEMASVACESQRLAIEFANMNIAQSVCRELTEANAGSKRYLSLLIIIRNLASLDVVQEEEGILYRSASIFSKENIHREILQTLKLLVEERERTNSRSTDELIHESILALTALCLTRLALTDLMDKRVGYLPLLFQLNQLHSGPVVVAAVLKALTGILSCPRNWFPLRYDEVILEYQALFSEITRKLQRAVPLLQYLGEKGTKFLPMCNLVPEAEKALYFRSDRKCIANLYAPSMHELLVSVIDLITLYNKEANRANHVAVRVTKDLNQNKREAFLFACLNTPSDDVRLAVVSCLLEIQLSEFDHQEINYLVELLANVMNISSGKTEEVLGGSFKLLTKLCVSSHQAGSSYRVNFAEKSALAAFSILERNEQRDTRGQVVESQQKRILSTACVQFIQACSQFKNLRNFLRSHKVLEKMISVLYIEDMNSTMVKLHPGIEGEISRSSYSPNLVERTLCGRQVEYLLRTLVGVRAVSPVRVVAPRVLRRIADVLMGIPDPTLKMLKVGWGLESEEVEDEESKKILLLQDGSSVSSDAGTDAESKLDSEVFNDHDSLDYPPYVYAQMKEAADANVDFTGLTNKQRLREKKMSALWSSLMASQVGCTDIWVDSKISSDEEHADMLQQHQLLIHFSGLERLLLFLVGALEKATEGMGAFPGNNVARDNTEGDSSASGAAAAGIPTSLSITSILNSFSMSNPIGVLEEICLRGSAKESMMEKLSKTTDPRNALSGKELLLRYFMEESLTSSATKDSSSSGAGGGTDTENTRLLDEYPDADTVMFNPNACAHIRRDSQVTDTLVAGLRVIYALLRNGSADTKEAAKKILLVPSKLKILACICSGSRFHPVWPQALIGAKFMAICYEICVMRGVQREISSEDLEIYAIVCSVAGRIMSTLRFFVENRETGGSVSTNDLITAVHTTRTLALIARQFSYLRLPSSVGKVSDAVKNAALSATWNALMPFESIVRGCISVLIACSGRGQSSLPMANYCVREHVVQFLVAAFGASSSSRYEVLEELVRVQIHDKHCFRSTFVQELLHRVAVDSFEGKLRYFMWKNVFADSSTNAVSSSNLRQEEKGFKVIEKKEPQANSGGFLSICAGSRPKSSAAKEKFNQSQQVVDTNGVVRKNWLIEPPPALTQKSLGSKERRQQWEYDRVGTERILVTGFCDVYESGTAPQRRLVVLTSEAYYMFGEPEVGKGWQILESNDDVYTNPLLFAHPSILSSQNDSGLPTLLWRKPYRAVERIILGLYGERLHLLHRSSDLPGRTEATTITMVSYIAGIAVRMYTFFMQMCREWALIETSIEVESSQINPPKEEFDKPLKDAIQGVLEKLDGVESVVTKEVVNSQSSSTADDTPKFEFAESTCLFTRLNSVMFSQVLLVKPNGNTLPRGILCTDKHFTLMEVNWQHWTFPSDFEQERKQLLRSVNTKNMKESMQNDQGARARMIANMNAHIEVRIEKENAQRRKILKTDRQARYTHSLLDLNEVIVSKGDEPLLTLGFGKQAQSVVGGGLGVRKSALPGTGEAVASKAYYEVLFYDHQTRESWCEKLIPRLVQLK